MLKLKYNLPNIASLIFLFFLIFIIVKVLYKGNQLKKYGIVITGKIVLITKNNNVKGGGGSSIKYNYSYDNSDYIDFSANSGTLNDYENDFINKFFPVLLNPKTKESVILIFKDDFEEYNVPFPDSLNWVEDKLKKYLE